MEFFLQVALIRAAIAAMVPVALSIGVFSSCVVGDMLAAGRGLM